MGCNIILYPYRYDCVGNVIYLPASVWYPSVWLEGMSSKHPHLSSEELAEFREIFNLVDLDKGGSISKDELKQLMTTLGLKPTQEELNAMVDEIDTDKSGEIDFDGA